MRLRLLVAVALAFPACSGRGTLSGHVQLFAVQPVQPAFADLKKAFESHHPKVIVDGEFAAMRTLTQQVLHSAPGDVLVSSDEASVAALREQHLVLGASRTVARGYPGAVLASTAHRALARAFLDFLASTESHRILVRHGLR